MTAASTFERGSVVLTPWPDPSGILIKRRPAVVVQSPSVRTEFGHIALVPLTGTIRRYDRTLSMCRYLVVPDTTEYDLMSLKTSSVILADRVLSVEAAHIISVIGACPPPTLQWIDMALVHVFGLSETIIARFLPRNR